MGKDRKHMKNLREKRIESIQKQINEHKEKIKKEKGRKDTTKDYWKKEINEKFSKQIDEDEEYLDEKSKNHVFYHTLKCVICLGSAKIY